MRNQRTTRLIQLLLLVILSMLGIVHAQTNTDPMNTNINSIIPTQDVYCDGSYSTIATGVSSENDNLHLCPRVPASGDLASVPSSVVDWMLVELRAVAHGGTAGTTQAQNALPDTLVARKPAFLLSNGRIVDAELYAALDDQDITPCTSLTAHANCPDVEFNQGDVATALDNKDLYIIIRHRNHVDIISRTHIDEESSGVYIYDFNTATAALGDGSLKPKISTADGNTYQVMKGGDATGDGLVTGVDYAGAVANELGTSSYSASDTSFDTLILGTDYAGVIAPNIGSGTFVP